MTDHKIERLLAEVDVVVKWSLKGHGKLSEVEKHIIDLVCLHGTSEGAKKVIKFLKNHNSHQAKNIFAYQVKVGLTDKISEWEKQEKNTEIGKLLTKTRKALDKAEQFLCKCKEIDEEKYRTIRSNLSDLLSDLEKIRANQRVS